MTNERKRMFDIRGAKARFHLYQEGARVRFSSSPPLWGGFRWGLFSSSTAQFMQADNYIQSPEEYDSYNRYAYCRYNPFKFTDPSGEDYSDPGTGTALSTYQPDSPIVGCEGPPAGYVAPRQPRRIYVMDGTVKIFGSGTSWFGHGGLETVHFFMLDLSSWSSGGGNNPGVYNGFTGDAAPKSKKNEANAGVLALPFAAAIATAIGIAAKIGATVVGVAATGMILGTIFIPSSERIPDNVYQATSWEGAMSKAQRRDKNGPPPNMSDYDPKNKEADYFLKAALAREGIKWTKEIASD